MKNLINNEKGKNKKAVSEVLATILIVLFVIAALVIVSVVLFQFIRKQSESITAGCVTIDIAITKAEFNATSSMAIVYLKRHSGDADMTGMKFIFDGREKVPSVGSDNATLKILETGKYIFSNITSKPKKIEAAPVIMTEAEKEMNCGIKALIKEKDIAEKTISSVSTASPSSSAPQLQDIRDGLVAEWRFDDLQYDDNFTSTAIDTIRWNIKNLGGGSSTQNDYIRQTVTTSTWSIADVNSSWYLKGDFDIQVDFSLINFPNPPSDHVFTNLQVFVNPNNLVEINRDRGQQWGNRYIAVTRIGGTNNYNSVLTSDTSGKFRITRTGSTINTYYYSSGWVQLSSYAVSSSDALVILRTSSSTSGYATEVQYDNFQVTKGEPVADASGNSNNGTIDGAVWTAGKKGNALQFDGVDDYVRIPDSSSLDVTTRFTLEVWINPRSLMQDPAQGAIISKNGGAGGNNGYQFVLTNSNTQLSCQFNAQGETWPTNYVNAFVTIPTDKWSHIICTYNNSDLKIYVNGTLINSANIGSKTVVNSASSLRISSDDNNNGFFNGIIDEVRIYNKALSAEEINQLYQFYQ